MNTMLVCRIIAALGLGFTAMCAPAQVRPPTTEQLGRDPGALRQEAEQQRARERDQQRGDQQQRDQEWNDTQRRQQSRAAADTEHDEAVRRNWQQRPPLAPKQNPLLGRWESFGVGQRTGAGGLIGEITGGICASRVGRGTIEFRPAGLVAIGSDGREQAMYRAEYRGGGSRVVVLPQGGTLFGYMIVDFDRPGHAIASEAGCVLTRSGEAARTPAAANTAPATRGAAAMQWVPLATTVASGSLDVYIARSAIRRSGNSARMWDLWDFKTARMFEGKPFLSSRNEYEYDCTGARRRMLSTAKFSGHMGQGAVVGSDDSTRAWEAIAPGAPIDSWKIACSRP